MKRNREIRLLTLIIMISFCLSACGQETKHNETLPATTESVVEGIEYPPYDTTAVYPEASGSLTLDINMDNSSMMRQAIEIYRRMYPNVEIILHEYINPADTKAYYDALPADLMAGKASDLVFYGFWTFSDIHKTMDAGVFADLDPLFSEDDSFHLDNLHREIIDGSKYRGHRYYVPLSYSLCGFLSAQETLERVGLSGCDKMGYTEFVTTLREYAEANRDRTDEWLMPFFSSLYFCQYGNVDILNYEDQTVTLDTEEFHRTMELLKTGHSYMSARRSDSALIWNSDALSDGRMIFELTDNAHQILYFMHYLNLLAKSTPTAFTMPGTKGKTGAYAYFSAAIPEASRNRENAYAFLKILLSEEVQGNRSHYIEIPVNNRGRKTRYDTYLEGMYFEMMCGDIEKETGVDVTGKFTPEMKAHLESLYENVAFVVRNEALDAFIMEAMTPYFEGEKDYDACVGELRNKLELYIRE